MTFNLFWIDFFWSEKLFGFGIFSFRDECSKSLLSIYWDNGEIMIDLLWINIISIWILR